MLIIVMHNNRDYLNYARQLAKKEGINNTTIIEKENIGTRLIGGNVDFIFSKGTALETYDKSLIAVTDEEKNQKSSWIPLKEMTI